MECTTKEVANEGDPCADEKVESGLYNRILEVFEGLNLV